MCVPLEAQLLAEEKAMALNSPAASFNSLGCSLPN